jgi:hypothetical protein
MALRQLKNSLWAQLAGDTSGRPPALDGVKTIAESLPQNWSSKRLTLASHLLYSVEPSGDIPCATPGCCLTRRRRPESPSSQRVLCILGERD